MNVFTIDSNNQITHSICHTPNNYWITTNEMFSKFGIKIITPNVFGQENNIIFYCFCVYFNWYQSFKIIVFFCCNLWYFVVWILCMEFTSLPHCLILICVTFHHTLRITDINSDKLSEVFYFKFLNLDGQDRRKCNIVEWSDTVEWTGLITLKFAGLCLTLQLLDISDWNLQIWVWMSISI